MPPSETTLLLPSETYRSPFSHKIRASRLHLALVASQAEAAHKEFSDIEKKHALRVFRALIAGGAAPRLPEIEGVEKPTKASSDADIEAWVTKFYVNVAANELAVRLRGGKISYVVKDVAEAKALLWGELKMKPRRGEDASSGTGEGDDLEIGREEDFVIKVGDRLVVDQVRVARESASQAPGSSGDGAAQPPGSSGVVGAAGTSTVAPELGPPPTVSLVLKRTLRREASDVVQHRKEELLAFSLRPIPLATLDRLRERAEWNEGFGLEKGIDCVVCASSLQEDAAAVARGERSVFDRCLYGSLAQCKHKCGHSSFVHAACLKKHGKCPMWGCGAKYSWGTAEDVAKNVRLDANYSRGFPQPPRADEDARASRPSGSGVAPAGGGGAGGVSGAGRRGECGRWGSVARGDLREPLLQEHMLDEHQHHTADAQPTTRRASEVHGGLGLFEEDSDGSGGSFQ